MSIEIQFLGAAECVTGSQFLVTAGDRRVLVDCGMFQGSPEETERNRLPFTHDPRALDAVLLTHAHLDHCGRVPALVRGGFEGHIVATEPTVDLAEIVLRDAAKLQREFAERWRRHHPESEAEAAGIEKETETDDPDLPKRLRSAPPEGRTETREPLFDESDVDGVMRQARGVEYDSEVEITDGVTAIYHDAGHILGSAIIELRIREADAGGTTSIVFSGDLGRDNTPILRNPARIAHADHVVVESTYGNREHGTTEQAIDEFAAAINEAVRDRGVLLVPAYAIGRTQEVIWVLDQLERDGRIPRVPLYVDSPMASRATDVYERHPDAFDEETSRLLRRGESPLEYPGQVFTDTVEQSKAIRTAERPMMIVASSGMLTGGRVMHHLKDFIPDPASTLLFIGYQGEGTLGRHLQDGGTTARIDGREWPVRCRVRSISGFSAHADQHELDRWLGSFGSAAEALDDGRPRTVFLVHGDPDATAAFGARITDALRLRAHLPRHQERVVLRG